MTKKKSPRLNTTVKLREAVRERRLRELEMRKAGMSYNQIAKVFGITSRTVFDDIRIITKPDQVCPDLEMAIDLQRIEMALLPLSQGVRNGDHKSIEQWKKLIDTRHKLLARNKAESVENKLANLSVKVINDVEIEKL